MESIYVLVGMAIGVLSGFFGVGGGFILTPLLILFGFPPVTAIGTSLMYSIGTSVSGVYAHLKMNNIFWKTAAVLGVIGVAATQAAHPLVLWLEAEKLDKTVIPILYIILLGYFALSLLMKSSKQEGGRGTFRFSWAKALFIGFTGGFLSTTLGVGGGFIMVPLLISMMHLPARKAVGTSLVSVFAIVTAGFISYAYSTPLDFKLGAFLIIGALIGGQLGAKLTSIYDDRQIKNYLGLLYVVTLLSVVMKLMNQDEAGIMVLGGYVSFLLLLFVKDTISYQRRKTSPTN
ncbi:sulfite exporter TauE/SafE family protein [Fictibacillus iocasae]|uniref:Probable membrane transporter protein n=1 Tax=Fictibacillus iocasae TaxID=2715437 RepID=A0ABW2NKV4_9BACL